MLTDHLRSEGVEEDPNCDIIFVIVVRRTILLGSKGHKRMGVSTSTAAERYFEMIVCLTTSIGC